MLSSGHDNAVARSHWRQSVASIVSPSQSSSSSSTGVRLVFLVSACEHCEHDLASEHAQYGDIVHTSLRDGHRKLEHVAEVPHEGAKLLRGKRYTFKNMQIFRNPMLEN